MARYLLAGLALLLLVSVAALAPAVQGTAVAPAAGPLAIVSLSPSPNSTVASTTPTISAQFVDTGGTVNPSAVFLIVDGLNVTTVSSVTITTQQITYTPPSIIALKNGLNNVTITASDSSGHTATVSWNFTVNTNLTTSPTLFSSVKPTTILLYIAITAALVGAAMGGYILYLRQTTRFTFRRYFATHPVKTQYLVIYLPLVLAIIVLIVGLDYVYNTPGLPPQAPDYVFIVALFVALTAWGIDSRHEINRIHAYERTFAQFLFELADAMRGGIDPAKALVELSKTNANILRKPLRIAADAVRVGRPFEVVLRDMVRPMRSDLISRYAGLIADASGIGGETATVVYRAAKDMDEFVKIEEEREKELALPVAVVYISFGVLTAVLFALIAIAPDLGSLNINFLGGNPLATNPNTPTAVPRLDVASIKERFFELMLINGLGTGAIIGAFTEGRARYGILHSLGIIAAIAIAFAVVFPG